ncbi:hypothetical protein, partial [Methanothermococcus sp.]|uniref:hypothetical protein n=1 Tax=Methanothermococcus sp. TaxID=2614238 RepID=UPI0025F812FF
MANIFHKKGQLSLELILLIFAVFLGGTVVSLELTKNVNFKSNYMGDIKNMTFSGFIDEGSGSGSNIIKTIGGDNTTTGSNNTIGGDNTTTGSNNTIGGDNTTTGSNNTIGGDNTT